MNLEQFQKLVARAQFTLIGKRPTKYGEILLAERQCVVADGPLRGRPFYETLWVLNRDGLDLGRTVRNEQWDRKNGSRTMRFVPQSERIAEAIADAEQFCKDCKRLGRF